MKIGKVEGSPEEIHDFFQNNGLNIADYLERPETPLKPVWLAIPIVFFITSLSWLTLITPTSISLRTFLFLIGCGAGIWLAVTIQIRFKNTWASVFVAVGIILIMLVAIGIITPVEMVQHLQEFKK